MELRRMNRDTDRAGSSVCTRDDRKVGAAPSLRPAHYYIDAGAGRVWCPGRWDAATQRSDPQRRSRRALLVYLDEVAFDGEHIGRND